VDTMTYTGTHICQRPECGKKFDIGYGGGKAKYCPDCRVIVMAERHRVYSRRWRMRKMDGGDGKSPPNHEKVGSLAL